MQEKSRMRELLAFLSTVRGDLANIASPPSMLAPRSVVEVPSCWSERPSLFAAPALESDPEKRALLVLKWFLSSLRTQFYLGGDTSLALKKPLNSFLGELFIGSWTDEGATTKLVTEQVSHHPPITACHMSDKEHGISAEGYSRVEMTFDGNINIKQFGHATIHIDEFDEDYLIPFPDARVKGLLSGHLYPELVGNYAIVSSSGYVSEITFSGKGYFSGAKNTFKAVMYQKSDIAKTPIYNIDGQWSDKFTVRQEDEILETVDTASSPAKVIYPDTKDSWETRDTWKSTIDALKSGNMKVASIEKSKLEEAQRAMRRREAAQEKEWEPVFFSTKDQDEERSSFESLASETSWQLHFEKTKGIWRFDPEKAERAATPFHESLTPFGCV
jgi:oxysterol-binding protein-related protein 9/10/11